MLADLRYAFRLIARSPGFAVTAILTLTFGIGMTSAIFSVVDAVLLRPVPFPVASRLVMVWETDRDTGTSHEPGAWPDFVDFKERSRRIESFGGFIPGEVTLTPDRGEPSRLAGLRVTHDLLPLLGVTPVLGRTFTPDDDRVGGPALVLISERLWETAFQRDSGVLGRTLRLDEVPMTIVGVVPRQADFGILQVLSAADYGRGFADRDRGTIVDVWAPLQADPERLVRDTHPLLMVGRLAPDATVETAQDELSAIAADLERTYQSNRARGVFLEPLRQVIFGPSQPALVVLLTAVGLVLLISCVNVANLLLARGTARRREVAVRAALGAGTRALARQFVVENLVLTAIAAALGVVVAFVGLQALVALAPADVPRLETAGIDGRVLAVALAIAVITGLAFGLLPILQARRTNLTTALNADDARGTTGGREGRATRSALVVAEIAFAVVLAVGAGLLIRSFWQLRQVDPGFDPSGVLKVEFQLPGSRYPVRMDRWPDFHEMHRFNAALVERVTALPGVEAAAVAASHPLNAGFTNSFVIVGREDASRDLPEISVRQVTPGYFRTVRLPLLRGRPLEDADGTLAPAVIVINEATAQRIFPGEDPLGQQIGFWGTRRTIVGIVANEKFHGIAAAEPIAAYIALAQAPTRSGAQSLLVRTATEPASLAGPVREAIAAIDPGLAIFGVEPLERTLANSIAVERFVVLLLIVFATLALALAALGIHGVLSYTVAQRTREIGIRMALGASPDRVTRLVLRQGTWLTLLGLGLGLVFSVLFARTIAGLLFGVSIGDPLTFVLVPVVLGLVAALAMWLPVRRAITVDPLTALRQN